MWHHHGNDTTTSPGAILLHSSLLGCIEIWITLYVPLYWYTMESNTFRGCICSLCKELYTLWNFKDWIIKNILSNHRCRNLYSTSQNLWFHCDIPMKLGLFSGAQRKSRRNSSEKVCELSDQALCLASMYIVQGMYLKNGSTLWAIIPNYFGTLPYFFNTQLDVTRCIMGEVSSEGSFLTFIL